MYFYFSLIAIAVIVGAIIVAIGMLKAAANMQTIMLVNILKSPSAVSCHLLIAILCIVWQIQIFPGFICLLPNF